MAVSLGPNGLTLDNFTIEDDAPNAIIQVKSALKTSVASFTSSSTNTFVDLSGLSVSITPSSTSSKILVIVNVNVANSTSATTHVRAMRGSTPIHIGDTAGNRLRDSAATRTAADPYELSIENLCFQHLDSPNTTSATTYKVQGTLGSTYSGTFYLNRPANNGDNDFSPRTASSIIVMEIAS